METNITIDPLVRVEGHLKVECVVDDGEVKTAACSGPMFRGFERLLIGRDPLDAQQITQRVCGVCPAVHAAASALALDEVLGTNTSIPPNGRIARNIEILCLRWTPPTEPDSTVLADDSRPHVSEHPFGVITGKVRFRKDRLALQEQAGKQQAGLHLCTGHLLGK